MSLDRQDKTIDLTLGIEVVSQVALDKSKGDLKPVTDRRRILKRTARNLQSLREPRGRIIRLPRPPLYLLTFVLMVLIPSAACQVYLAFVASDQYQAQARFAVRSAQDQAKEGMAALSALAQGASLSSTSMAGQDAHIVVSYIRSRAIVEDLQRAVNIRDIFRRPEADFWARLKKNATAEELTDYWLAMVTTNVDGPSGIVTLYVRAFRQQDAFDLTQAILNASEKLVNDVSLRARRDTMSRSEGELFRAEGLVDQSLQDMRVFREKMGFIDPVATASMTSHLITDAMAEKIKLENELYVATKMMSTNAPSLTSLNTRLQAINDQIEKLKASLTSDSNAASPISKALVRFEELELKRIFSEKMYTLAQDALERARAQAERQNIYLTVFVPAALPEEARFPERLSLSIIIPLTLLILWGIFALLIATIEDHRN